MTRTLLLLLALVLISCNEEKSTSETVFFAGEIVNPTSNQVVLFKGSKVIDSSTLDDNNRFKFNLKNIENGLYHFNHAPEYQYVYLEKGDSLQVRLNTMDFDESLVFSGTNELLNNFLLELFLAEEEETNIMYSKYYELEPDDFSEKVNSIITDKVNRLEKLKTNNEVSIAGYEMLKGSINYTYNRFKEIYPFQHKRKTTEQNFHQLPKDFYAYRNEVNYNDDNLTYLRPYYDFLKSHFGNLAYMNCKENCSKDNKKGSEQLHFYQHKLKLLDSLVENKELRDNLFRNVAFDYLLKKRDTPENIELFISDFEKVSKNNMHLEEIEKLHDGIVNLQPSKTIPNLTIVDINKQAKSLQDIAASKKAIFYFWTGNNKKQYQDIFKRINQLKEKRPDHELIGINIRTSYEDWVGIVTSSKLDSTTQYHTDNFKELTETLVLYPMNKAIVTDNAVIVDGFSNIYAD